MPKVADNPPVVVEINVDDAALPGDTVQNGAFVKDAPKVIEQLVALVNETLPAKSLEPVARENPAQELAVGTEFVLPVIRLAVSVPVRVAPVAFMDPDLSLADPFPISITPAESRESAVSIPVALGSPEVHPRIPAPVILAVSEPADAENNSIIVEPPPPTSSVISRQPPQRE